MKSNRNWLFLGMGFILSALLVLVGEAWAGLPEVGNASKIAKISSRSVGLLSTATHKKLQRAMNYVEGKEFSKAVDLLSRMEKSAKDRKGEMAQIVQNRGFAYLQMDKVKEARADFLKVLSLEVLPLAPTLTTMYALAQIEYTLKKPKKAKAMLQSWFALSESPGAESYVLLGSMLAEEGKRREALLHIEKAISLTATPKKQWLQFAAGLNMEAKNYKKASLYLKKLTSQYPAEKKHWKQLAAAYLSLQDHKRALSTLSMAHKWGLLDKEVDYLNLTSLFLGRGAPFWAAKTLEQGIEKKIVAKSYRNLTLLAQSHLQAQDLRKALPVLNKANSVSKSGDSLLLAGQLMLDLEDWKGAESSLVKAIKKGGLKRPGRGHMGLGIAYYQQGKLEKARKSFLVAAKHDDSEAAAGQWLSQLK